MARPKLRTRLCDLLGIEYPIISAGMGPSLVGEKPGAPVELVVAVSEAGGMGVLGGAGHTIEQLREDIRKIRSLTDRPFGVDLLLPRQQVQQGDAKADDSAQVPLAALIHGLPKKHLEWFRSIQKEYNLEDPKAVANVGATTNRPHAAVKVCIEEKIPLFCAGLGDPGFMVKEAHAAGIKVLGISGNTKNAKRMAESGVDFVVAQGHEAGGHTGAIGSMALWPQAIDAAAPTPVLGAGGIGDGRGVAAALAVGCIGAWVGTRFLATIEGGLEATQEQHILRASDEDTRRAYWHTGKTSRTIYGEIHKLWENSGLEPLPFPLQALLSSALMSSFRAAGRGEFLSPFAGQISGLITEIKPAAKALEEMVEQAVDILTRRLPSSVQASAA
jgi:nitronate monooxygenase